MKAIMRPNFILFTVLILLAGIAFYLYQGKKNNEKKLVKADRGFTIGDINDVSKIVVKHVKLPPLVFTKESRLWTINGKYPADPGVMVHIESVLTKIRLLYVPPSNTTPTILKSIKENGIQVDVYTDDQEQPYKIFHLGADTQDGEGTYMVLGGTSQPFAMHLPGLSGGLRSRFEQPTDNYRDKFIFQTPVDEITSLKVQYHKDNLHSFLIKNEGDFSIFPLMIRERSLLANKMLIKSYLSQFESLGAEKLMNQYPDKEKILTSVPSFTVELQNKEGSKTSYIFYPYDDYETDFGPANSPAEIRLQNRMYVLVDSIDFYVVQNRVFGNVFRGYDEFMTK